MYAIRVNGRITYPTYATLNDAYRAADALNEIRPDAKVTVEEVTPSE